MTPAQFQSIALEIVKNYWRIKAAAAFYRASHSETNVNLEYANIPSVGISTQFGPETVGDATVALNDFIDTRLPRDLFLALISEFEGRLSGRLVSLGAPAGGMLGNKQN